MRCAPASCRAWPTLAPYARDMREMYVGVGQVTSAYSSVWKLWTQGDEFYAAQVTVRGRFVKMSAHRSGVCRFATVEDSDLDVDWDRDDDPRVIHRWTIAKVGTDPWCRCFALLVPTVYIPERSDLTGWMRQRHLDRTLWIDPAPLGLANAIDCVRAEDPEAPLSDFVQGDYDLLGSLDMRSGAVIWVIASTTPLPAKDFANWQQEISNAIFTWDEEGVEAFGAMVAPADFYVPVIRELALGKSNFRVAAPGRPARPKSRGRRRRR